MTNRTIDRAFNKVFGTAATEAPCQPKEKVVSEEEQLRKTAAPLTTKDACKRMLLAWKDKDYFRLLQLPYPTVDALYRPVWDVTPGEVSKAYRKLSVLVHPDKNPGEDARQAFEALNEAHRMLKDPSKREEALKEGLVRAKREREMQEARATVEERVQLNAQKKQEIKKLRKEEGQSFHDTIAQQARRRVEEARRKKEMASKSRYRCDESDMGDTQLGDGGSGGEEEEEYRREERAKKRKKPMFI